MYTVFCWQGWSDKKHVGDVVIQHIAFIMDGNRRWAKQQGLAAVLGHKHGVDSVRRVVEFCLKKGISYVSLYTFSLENFKRTEDEKSYLFELLIKEASKGVAEFVEQGVRLRFLGDRTLFPKSVCSSLETLEQKTAHLDKLIVNFLFCYGGRQEMVAGVKSVVQKVQRGELKVEDINENLFGSELWCGNQPDPDLIVRTGGEQRLSNFLLYQAAYSEFIFLDCYWPALSQADLEQVYETFMARKRRFGQ